MSECRKDVIIIGGGPAGMTAGLYCARNGRRALIIEKQGFGGQISFSPRVENYPGVMAMSGNEFADKMMDQLMAHGVELEFAEAIRIEDEGSFKRVFTDDGGCFEGRAVIIASGVKHRLLGIEGEEDFIGNGISFCAVCDGDFYTGQRVAVAGGGNSALQEALLLAEKCESVIMLQDMPEFTGDALLADALIKKPNVCVFKGVNILSLITEDSRIKGVRVKNIADGKEFDVACSGVFVAIGLVPENSSFKAFADLDASGYFDSSEDCLTKTPGIFCAGDCRKKNVRQLTTAVADGASAALAACRYIDGINA